jgi:hypothetical protein
MGKISSYTVDTTVEGTDLLIGTDAATNNATKNYTVQSIATFAASNLLVSSTVPAASTDAGTQGQIAADSTHLYICVQTQSGGVADTWKRITLDTF